MSDALPALPLEAWEPTKNTLHLYAQIVGKIKLACVPHRNHWWNVTFQVDERGLTTRRIRHDGVDFSIEFDLIDHRLIVRTDHDRIDAIPLRDGLSVAEFYTRLFAVLGELGINITIRAVPFGIPMTTPFAQDTEHASYDPSWAERYATVLRWSDEVLGEFNSWFCGKSSPVQVFWHSFDLAVGRYSGRRAPEMPGADPVTREAYTHEVISSGWWPGDRSDPEPAFYSYTHPEPAGLAREPLRPAGARWVPTGATHQARLSWDEVRTAARPRDTLLEFLQSAYAAGAVAANWPYEDFYSTACPARGRIAGRPAAVR